MNNRRIAKTGLECNRLWSLCKTHRHCAIHAELLWQLPEETWLVSIAAYNSIPNNYTRRSKKLALAIVKMLMSCQAMLAAKDSNRLQFTRVGLKVQDSIMELLFSSCHPKNTVQPMLEDVEFKTEPCWEPHKYDRPLVKANGKAVHHNSAPFWPDIFPRYLHKSKISWIAWGVGQLGLVEEKSTVCLLPLIMVINKCCESKSNSTTGFWPQAESCYHKMFKWLKNKVHILVTITLVLTTHTVICTWRIHMKMFLQQNEGRNNSEEKEPNCVATFPPERLQYSSLVQCYSLYGLRTSTRLTYQRTTHSRRACICYVGQERVPVQGL